LRSVVRLESALSTRLLFQVEYAVEVTLKLRRGTFSLSWGGR